VTANDWDADEYMRAVEAGEVTMPGFERTWQPVDLTDVLSGRYERPKPSVGRRMDGIGILYPGKVHTLSSESEAGKTWFALELAAQEIRDGRDVVYLDFEDDEGGVVGRLLTMQVAPQVINDHFRYIRPTTQLGHAINVDDLRGAVTSATTFIVVDGVTEAMTLHGLNPLDNADIAEFGRLLPRRLSAWGPAVLCLDHVTKDRETRGRYAIGGVHKLNALDGAAFLLENRTAFGEGVTGRSTIRIAKDRPGGLRRHALPSKSGLHWFGDLVVEVHNDTWAEVYIEAAHEGDPNRRPVDVMTQIVRAIEEHGPLSANKVQALLGGKAEKNRKALAYLQLDGYLSEATPHALLKPYGGGSE
jgi:hypothetical protein